MLAAWIVPTLDELEDHCDSESEKMLRLARSKGTPQQRMAVFDIVDRNAGQRPRGRKP
jgi:hypothetical protein